MIEELERTATAFMSFLSTAAELGGVWTWLVAAALLLGLVYFFPRDRDVRLRLKWLSLLPIVWILVGLWAAFFSLGLIEMGGQGNPEWVFGPTRAAIPIFAILSLGLIVYLRRAFLFAVLFMLPNLYLTAVLAFVGQLAMTAF
jgi:hypothetical protein